MLILFIFFLLILNKRSFSAVFLFKYIILKYICLLHKQCGLSKMSLANEKIFYSICRNVKHDMAMTAKHLETAHKLNTVTECVAEEVAIWLGSVSHFCGPVYVQTIMSHWSKWKQHVVFEYPYIKNISNKIILLYITEKLNISKYILRVIC